MSCIKVFEEKINERHRQEKAMWTSLVETHISLRATVSHLVSEHARLKGQGSDTGPLEQVQEPARCIMAIDAEIARTEAMIVDLQRQEDVLEEENRREK